MQMDLESLVNPHIFTPSRSGFFLSVVVSSSLLATANGITSFPSASTTLCASTWAHRAPGLRRGVVIRRPLIPKRVTVWGVCQVTEKTPDDVDFV